MDQISNFVSQHWLALFVVYWVFSAAISSMPQPKANGYPLYLWAFNFGHSMAGSVGALIKTRFPQAEVAIQEISPNTAGGVTVTTTKVSGDVPKLEQK